MHAFPRFLSFFLTSLFTFHHITFATYNIYTISFFPESFGIIIISFSPFVTYTSTLDKQFHNRNLGQLLLRGTCGCYDILFEVILLDLLSSCRPSRDHGFTENNIQNRQVGVVRYVYVYLIRSMHLN